jgi:Zn-dependent protease with chaperone function
VKFDPALPDDTVNVGATHPLREAVTLIVGIALVGFLAFVALAAVVELVVPRISPGLEVRIFSRPEVVSALAPDAPESPDPRRAELGRLLGRVAGHWSENPYQLRVVIFEEATPNALAFPGGLVVVTTGLLDSVASENELAFVLAHEVGHFRNRDHLRGIGRALAFAVVVGAFGIGGSGGAAELALVAGRLTEAGFSRDQESDADEFALGLVQAEYGHVTGASGFFGRLPRPDNAVEREIEDYLSTHPLSEERIEAMRELADARGWRTDGRVVPLSAELAAPSAEH